MGSYLCPGETRGISRPVHLARLRAGFAACARCAHAGDVGCLPPPKPDVPSTRPQSHFLHREAIFCTERDAHGRSILRDAASALASLLWEDSPWTVPPSDWEAFHCAPPSAPGVCVAHDGTELSRRSFSDVCDILLRQGCRVEFLGAVSRPCLTRVVEASQGRAGLYLESGGSPAGVSLGILDAAGPWSRGGRLDDLVLRMDSGRRRSSRVGGSVRAADAVPDYAASLVEFFQGVADLDIGTLTLPSCLAEIWSSLEDQIPLRLRFVPGSVRFEQGEPSAASIRPLLDAIVRNRWAGGVIFGADGRQLWVVDRQHGLVPARDVCLWAAAQLREQAPGIPLRVVAFESAMWMEFSLDSTRLTFCPDSSEQLVNEMQRVQAGLGADGQGRLWMGTPRPRCDAWMTLAVVARAWGQSQR